MWFTVALQNNHTVNGKHRRISNILDHNITRKSTGNFSSNDFEEILHVGFRM